MNYRTLATLKEKLKAMDEQARKDITAPPYEQATACMEGL